MFTMKYMWILVADNSTVSAVAVLICPQHGKIFNAHIWAASDVKYLHSVMSEREHVIDFTVPYYDLVGITIMMKKPKVTTDLSDQDWICMWFWEGVANLALFFLQIVWLPDCQVPTSLFKFLSVLEESVWGCILVSPQKAAHHHHLWDQHHHLRDPDQKLNDDLY